MATNYEQAGRRLREMREARGWSRARLADRAGLSESSIRFLEAGQRPDGKPYRPRPETFRKIAFVLGAPEGPEIVRLFGLAHVADRLEHELMSLDEVYDLIPSPERRSLLRDALTDLDEIRNKMMRLAVDV